MTRHLAHATAALLLALSAWSCAAQAADVVRIGAPLALTGGLADEGKKQALAYDLWLTRVNASGGIDVGSQKKKVELLTYDYQSDGKRAQQLAEKLITDDKVHVMMSPFGSGHTKIVAGVAERYGIPVVASVASSGFSSMCPYASTRGSDLLTREPSNSAVSPASPVRV